VPFAGGIDWDAALMTTQKVGYDGAFVLELDGGEDALDVLRRAERACGELERRFITF
jgi:sugar phosphate isomerase/epimerase